MADNILRFKPLTADDMFKGFDKSFSTVSTANGEDLVWHYVDRSNVAWSTSADDMKNLFHSFGIAREDEEDWFKVFNVVDWYNAKRMVIIEIPQANIQSYIDGATLKVNVPVDTGATDYVTFYGSTFAGYPDPVNGYQITPDHSEGVYGGAYVYLFANTDSGLAGALPSGTYEAGTHHPYTGTVEGHKNPNSGMNNFDPDTASTVSHLAATHWQRGDNGNDRPYGIAFLDRGLIVIMDFYNRTDFIGNTELSGTAVWNVNSTGNFVATTVSGGTMEQNSVTAWRKDIVFTGTNANTSASVTYRTIDQSYKMIYFCHCAQNEFNSTSNHTYDHKKGYYRPEEADSLWITEIGLYDDDNEMLAYAKLSEPVEKNKLETLTFKVELEL